MLMFLYKSSSGIIFAHDEYGREVDPFNYKTYADYRLDALNASNPKTRFRHFIISPNGESLLEDKSRKDW